MTDYVAITIVSSFFTFLTGIFVFIIKSQFDRIDKHLEELNKTFSDNVMMLSEIENKQVMILESMKHDEDDIKKKIESIRETQLQDSSAFIKDKKYYFLYGSNNKIDPFLTRKYVPGVVGGITP